ncbi:MAG TPA: lamin tail domain-containing protein [Blastocatellia bacterium]|nr:lamin tail domain-containing protein [Blastocatellia bacterium]
MPGRSGRGLRLLSLLALFISVLSAATWLISAPQPVQSASGSIVISQVYPGGGSFRRGKFKNTFIELFNRGTVAVNVTGWSVQYAVGNDTTWRKTELSGTIAPGHYYLVQEGPVFGGIIELPQPDAVGSLRLDANAGRVALVSSRTLIESGTACPAGETIVDLVAYGAVTNCAEGSGPVEIEVSQSPQAIVRNEEGCQDTDDNAADFALRSPDPRNSSSFHSCQQADLETTITAPAEVQAGEPFTYQITTTNHGPAEALNVTVTATLTALPHIIEIGQAGALTDDTITWPLVQNLAAGESVTFTVLVKAPDTGQTMVATAAAVTDSTDPDESNNFPTALTTALAAVNSENNTIRISVIPDSDCTGPGSSFQAEIRITNTGLTPKPDNTGAEFVVRLPAELTSGGCFADLGNCRAVGPQIVKWDGALEVGETVTITFFAEVSFDAQPDTYCFTAVSYYDPDGDGMNDASTSATACIEAFCLDVSMPGDSPLPEEMLSDQKAGSVLIFPVITSSAINPAAANTRINLTSTSPDESVTVHLFFVDGSSCSVADTFLCLTSNQTASFTVSDADPGVTGYLIAVAVDGRTGCPREFNFLIGDEYVRFESGHAANLGAEAVAALPGATPLCELNTIPATATLDFDGFSYNALPRALAINSIASPEDGDSMMLILDRIGGSLITHTDALGSLFGLLFDDLENPRSFTFSGGCQFRSLLSNQFPRTTPRLSQVIPAGRRGWLKLWTAEDCAILGAVISLSPHARTSQNAFNQGHNLHKLTLTTSARLTIPVFPPLCN